MGFRTIWCYLQKKLQSFERLLKYTSGLRIVLSLAGDAPR